MASDETARDGEEDPTPPTTTFQAIDRTHSPASISLPEELWVTMLETPCTFGADIFAGVMLNLIKNPNITSSHLFRADIFYDSEKDRLLNGSLVNHLKNGYRPLPYDLPGYTLRRTIVRQMVPRNPQLDKPLIQTCHSFTKGHDGQDDVVVYLPHVSQPSDLPFYHPTVSRLAFAHSRPAQHDDEAKLSISYCLFPGTEITTKLTRTALRLLQTIHKHGQGQLRGYEKRVHLDQIIPQKRYQDTYARLKAKYGRLLSEKWVEVTDPGKHVFEDIGIAAYLVELWSEMYATSSGAATGEASSESNGDIKFPGFVDIGCGNGLLTYILLEEGYEGFGFDARERKTWSIFPEHVQAKLERRLLIPSVFNGEDIESNSRDNWQDGLFQQGTFIISNHADELTAWTPLLAYLNDSAFIAIPCCSHDLAGSRFRAPLLTKASKAANVAPARLPQQPDHISSDNAEESRPAQAAETGSLKRTEAQKKMPSAYSTLCSYVTSLAEDVGFEPEKDVLRIPSTRNHCIVGRRRSGVASAQLDERKAKVTEIVERELGRDVGAVGREWIERAEKLAKKPGSGH